MINFFYIFFHNFCIYYPKHTYYLKILNQVFPEMLFYIFCSIFCISYILIFFVLFNIFYYLKKSFQEETLNEKNLEFFFNFVKKKQGLCILMSYKINNVFKTVLETLFYLFIFIMIFIFMRLFKLKKVFDVKESLSKYITLPLIFKII